MLLSPVGLIRQGEKYEAIKVCCGEAAVGPGGAHDSAGDRQGIESGGEAGWKKK